MKFTTDLLAANWWEPGTPNLFDVGDLSAMVGLLALSSGIILGITRWWLKLMRKMMKEEIAIATAPIHPNANGGLSLADVARKTNKLEEQMECLVQQQTETKDLLIKVLAQSVIIPDSPAPVEKSVRSRSRKTQ